MGSSISMKDRVFRSLFVSLAVGLGWAIRGDFGHMIGAMYPGAALGLAFAYVSGQKRLFLWAPVIGSLTGLGIGAGGHTSYGILHGYAQADTFINYAYGFFTLFMQGGVWGVFAGAAVGLLLERNRLKWTEWLEATAAVFVAGCAFYFVVVVLLGFHVNPPRSDASIGYVGGAMGLFAQLTYRKKASGFKGALFGFLGFGLGMSAGRLFGNIANIAQAPLGFTINSWNVMEMSVGLIGGFVFAFGMLGKRAPEAMQRAPRPVLSVLGAFYTTSLILLLHRATRVELPKNLQEWTESFTKFGFADPSGYAATTLRNLNLICAAGVLLTAVWIYLLLSNRTKLAWFPVMLLSLEMLLYQNTSALFWYYPPAPGRINMHVVFWVLFVLMAGYVVVRELFAPHSEASDEHEVADRVNWRAWVSGAVAAYVAILGVSHFVNGPGTMPSANTRWPIWSHSDGPFPGRQTPAPPAQKGS